MINYLYHRVPENMKGDILYPLNQLKNVYPDIYLKEVEKYKGREEVMKQEVPYLNCLWNDVLHLSAVHPIEIDNALRKEGTQLSGRLFYEIDPHLLETRNTVVYLFRDRSKDKSNFVPFDPEEVSEFSIFPKKTQSYYTEVIRRGGRPLLWVYVPHFMYLGSLNTVGLKIIEI